MFIPADADGRVTWKPSFILEQDVYWAVIHHGSEAGSERVERIVVLAGRVRAARLLAGGDGATEQFNVENLLDGTSEWCTAVFATPAQALDAKSDGWKRQRPPPPVLVVRRAP